MEEQENKCFSHFVDNRILQVTVLLEYFTDLINEFMY